VNEAAELDGFCPERLCDGSGWLLDEETNVARPCSCRERRIAKAVGRQLGRTGIPKRFRGVSMDRRPICDLDPTILAEIRRYVRNIDENLGDGRGLWFHGDVGTGKTSLAMLVSKAAHDAGHGIAVYSVPSLLAEIQGTYEESSSRSYLSLFNQLCRVDLLQLDDLGAERRTEWVLEQLYSIVNERWQNGRAMIVTTNAPDLNRENVVEKVREQVRALQSSIDIYRSAGQVDRQIERLERVVEELVQRDEASGQNHLHALREQVGPRTVSRLIEICGPPIPIMGRDLRIASA
jgi:DNA replication protein DnaC